MSNIYTSKINNELELKEKRMIPLEGMVKIIDRKVCEKT